jgi:hypothetical protein
MWNVEFGVRNEIECICKYALSPEGERGVATGDGFEPVDHESSNPLLYLHGGFRRLHPPYKTLCGRKTSFVADTVVGSEDSTHTTKLAKVNGLRR